MLRIVVGAAIAVVSALLSGSASASFIPVGAVPEAAPAALTLDTTLLHDSCPVHTRSSPVAFFPDGLTVVHGERIWDVSTARATGSLQGPLTNPGAPFRCDRFYGQTQVDISPSGALIATAEGDLNTVNLFGPGGVHQRELRGPLQGPPLVALRFLREGALLGVGDDGSIALWDLASGAERIVRPSPAAAVSRAQIVTDLDLVVLFESDRFVVVGEVSSVNPSVTVIAGANAAVPVDAIVLDRSTVVTSWNDGTVRTFESGALIRSESIGELYSGRGFFLAESALGFLVAASRDAIVLLSKDDLHILSTAVRGGGSVVLDLATASDGKTLIVSSSSGLDVWRLHEDGTEANLIAVADIPADEVLIGPNDTTIAARAFLQTTLIPLESLLFNRIPNYRLNIPQYGTPFSPNGSLVLSFGFPSITIRRSDDAGIVGEIAADRAVYGGFVSDNEFLVVRDDGALELWSTESFGLDRTYRFEGLVPYVPDLLSPSVAIVSDVSVLVFGAGGRLSLIDIASGSVVASVDAFGCNRGLSVSRIGERATSICRDASGNDFIRLWDLNTLGPIGMYEGRGAVFSADGRCLLVTERCCQATGHELGGVAVVDAQTGEIIALDLMSSARSIAFSADGQLIAGVGRISAVDPTPALGVWIAADGTRLAPLGISFADFSTVNWSSDSALLIVGRDNGHAVMLDLAGTTIHDLATAGPLSRVQALGGGELLILESRERVPGQETWHVSLWDVAGPNGPSLVSLPSVPFFGSVGVASSATTAHRIIVGGWLWNTDTGMPIVGPMQ